VIDWAAGRVASAVDRSRNYQVSFYVAFWDPKLRQFGPESKLAYIVWADWDATNGQAYVYLPGPNDAEYRLNAKAMSRGRTWEGNWFHANREWQDVWRRALRAP
jgi:hypothetical protein